MTTLFMFGVKGFSLDAIAQTVTIHSKSSRSYQSEQSLVGTVTRADGSSAVGTTVSVYDAGNLVAMAPVLEDGSWIATFNLEGEGKHKLVAENVDQAGNFSFATVTIDLAAIQPSHGRGHLHLVSNSAQR